MLDKRLNDKGKNWRHVLKSLKVLDYCLHEGSELVVTWARKNLFIIKTLREFQYIDEDGRDVGQNGMLRAAPPIGPTNNTQSEFRPRRLLH
jgi:epsin